MIGKEVQPCCCSSTSRSAVTRWASYSGTASSRDSWLPVRTGCSTSWARLGSHYQPTVTTYAPVREPFAPGAVLCAELKAPRCARMSDAPAHFHQAGHCIEAFWLPDQPQYDGP